MPQCLQIIGGVFSSAKCMALTEQDSSHFLHFMHFFSFSITPPPFLSDKAPVGQTATQERSPWHAKQWVAKNLPDKPPKVRTLMALSLSE